VRSLTALAPVRRRRAPLHPRRAWDRGPGAGPTVLMMQQNGPHATPLPPGVLSSGCPLLRLHALTCTQARPPPLRPSLTRRPFGRGAPPGAARRGAGEAGRGAAAGRARGGPRRWGRKGGAPGGACENRYRGRSTRVGGLRNLRTPQTAHQASIRHGGAHAAAVRGAAAPAPARNAEQGGATRARARHCKFEQIDAKQHGRDAVVRGANVRRAAPRPAARHAARVGAETPCGRRPSGLARSGAAAGGSPPA
jgi:hypothetical protein